MGIELKLKYKVDDKTITLFDMEFVNNNINNCIMTINNREKEIEPFYICEEEEIKNELEIKLNIICKVTDLSKMFLKCSDLLSIEITKGLYITEIFDNDEENFMNSMFKGCTSLISLPDISKFDVSNVVDMSSMFSNCSSLQNLPDISNWNTSNVKDMKKMFKNCSSLFHQI